LRSWWSRGGGQAGLKEARRYQGVRIPTFDVFLPYITTSVRLVEASGGLWRSEQEETKIVYGNTNILHFPDSTTTYAILLTLVSMSEGLRLFLNDTFEEMSRDLLRLSSSHRGQGTHLPIDTRARTYDHSH
jgi:hypothetical protein